MSARQSKGRSAIQIEGGDVDNDLKVYNGLPDDPIIRMGFVKKVYGILTVQLLYTSIFAAICLTFRSEPKFVKLMLNKVVAGVVVGLDISSLCALACCRMDK